MPLACLHKQIESSIIQLKLIITKSMGQIGTAAPMPVIPALIFPPTVME
jgi:hypothetical protein